MGFWTDRVVPRLVDRTLSTRRGDGAARGSLCRAARAGSLELGFGSGLNVRRLPARGRPRSTPSSRPTSAGRCPRRARGRAMPIPVERTGLDGQRLAAADDVVRRRAVDVHALHDPGRRAGAGGGTPGAAARRAASTSSSTALAPDAGVARWQHRLDPVQRRVAGGCHLSRDIPALVAGAGLDGHRAGARRTCPGRRVSRPWTLRVRRSRRRAAGMSDDSARAIAAAEALGLTYAVTRHGPVRSLDEAAAARGVEPRQIVKTMVVRLSDDDHRFVLVPGDREIAWPKLRALLGREPDLDAERGDGVRRHRLRARHDHAARQPSRRCR